MAKNAFIAHLRQLAAPLTIGRFQDKKGDGTLRIWLGRNCHKVVKLRNVRLVNGNAKNR